MPQFVTWATLKAKVKMDLDIEGEVFVRPAELVGYANEAIDEAEAEILTLAKDYFLARENIAIDPSSESYPLPSNIFGKKIRRIIYKNGSDIYAIKRMRDWNKFEEYEVAKLYNTANTLRYMIVNSTAGAPEILVSPTPNETATLTVWYQRQANQMDGNDDTIVDIPECFTFLSQFIKVRVYEKEGHPNLPGSIAVLEQQRALMRKKLANAEPDGDNEIETDLSSYEDMN